MIYNRVMGAHICQAQGKMELKSMVKQRKNGGIAQKCKMPEQRDKESLCRANLRNVKEQ